MSSITELLNEVKSALPLGVDLIAVSKTHPASFVQEAYDAGQRHFGENKVQEMTDKYEQLPKDICWHMIGHLQTNKVKYIAPYVHLIHSIDSPKLLETVNKEAGKAGRVISCLLQVHIASEETKFGFSIDEVETYIASGAIEKLENVKICGLMGMASFVDDIEQVHREFASLKTLFDRLGKQYFADKACFNTLSMGMSGDYNIAIGEGSTMVRIGNGIFGKRYYQL